jgi:hypothetical protein
MIPANPPITESSKLSVSICLTSRQRLAPQCQSHADFLLARRTTRKQKIRYICTRYQQNQSNNAK